jgi:hypothetical protein
MKMKKKIRILALSVLFVGCVPAPKPTIGAGTGIGSAQIHSEYGQAPRNYATAIRNYFSTKIKRGSTAQYKFSRPERAYRRKGLVYGGDIAWKGWLVETTVAVPTRTGRYLAPRKYMVLFKGEQVIDDILGDNHKLLTRVDR